MDPAKPACPFSQANAGDKLLPHTKNKEPDKTTQLFKKTVLTEAEQEEFYRIERDYHVNEIMREKGVTRDVAEAEYDFFS